MDKKDFLDQLINIPDKDKNVFSEYRVKFYDYPQELSVWATNFKTAGILGMAHAIHEHAHCGYIIAYIFSVRTGKRTNFEIQ